MSLKAFHVVFVACSVLLLLWMGVWNLGRYRAGGQPMDLAWAVLAGAGAVTLLIYGRYFLRKLKNISYL